MVQMSNPYREPNSNVRYTKALFLEESYSDKSAVLYTLKDVDHNGYPSLYRLYMEMADPLEINFAKTYFEGWEHWQMVANSNWFKSYISRWREELELSMRARALAAIVEAARDDSSKFNYEANKFLLTGGWKGKEAKESKVGRPTKEAIKREADALFEASKDSLEDFKRLSN